MKANRSGKNRRWLKLGTTTPTKKLSRLLSGLESPANRAIMSEIKCPVGQKMGDLAKLQFKEVPRKLIVRLL
jgi:hypothetical protein